MQFGIFTVGDVTMDPTTGRTPTEHERIQATVAIAKKAEDIGLDVFATGEHHNPPFAAPANPPVLLAHLAAQGRLRPEIQEVFSLEEIRKAHDLSESGHVRGKIVVRVG